MGYYGKGHLYIEEITMEMKKVTNNKCFGIVKQMVKMNVDVYVLSKRLDGAILISFPLSSE